MYRGRDLQRFTRGDPAYILVASTLPAGTAPIDAAAPRAFHGARERSSSPCAQAPNLVRLLGEPSCAVPAACRSAVLRSLRRPRKRAFEPMVAEAHVDCHGMATMEATEDAEEAHAEANAAADECCDATDSTRPSERGDMLPAAVALLTSAESLWTERASPTRARPLRRAKAEVPAAHFYC